MAVDNVSEAQSFPVNEIGEIVAQSGVGSTVIAGYLPSNMIPLDLNTGKLVVAGLYDAPNPSKLVKPFGIPEENAGVRNYTLRTTFKCDYPFYAVRFHFNHPSATVLANTTANFTTSNSAATPNVPGNPTWKNITINGSTSLTLTPSSTGWPAVTSSDIIAVTPQARVDGGTGYLLEVGVYFPTAGNTVGIRVAGAGDAATVSQTVDTYLMQCGASSGDAVTTPASFVRSVVGLGACVAVEFFTGVQTKESNILFVSGDSITQGQDGSRTHYGAAHLTAKALGLTLFNAGLAGKTRDVYLGYAQAQIANVKPRIAFYAPWSPNDADAFTAGTEEAVIKNAAQWVATCYANGAKPILATPTPKGSLTLGQETARRTIVQKVKDFCAATNVPYIDRDAVYTDYTVSTGGFKSGLSADALHPNLAGYTLEAELWKSVVKGLI